MKSVSKRNTYYDYVRGIAIILVVLGHSIQNTYPQDFDSVALFEIIYSFHMPLFMFLSGFVTYKANRELDTNWLKGKIIALVIPFLAWMVIPFIFRGNWSDFGAYCINVFKSPDYAYWFLWVLFLISVLNCQTAH